MRMDWAKGLEFDVPVVGEDLESLESVDWLFWVGCAGAYEDRAKKTTRAVAELLNMAGISFGVLGNGETCTGDAARRAGNEFVYQGLAQQNVATLTEAKVKQVVTTCAHCFNTLKNEYRDFGLELEVVHHTQLLNRLVRDGKLTPVAEGAGAAKRSITYHDPCFLGRHNQVYSPPRELLQVLPGAEYVEMERSAERSFCCGAGGARMWMEERIGERINENRTREAVATGADQIAVGCPFCRVMLDDGLTSAQSRGEAGEAVEVLDVAQMLLASVKGVSATRTKAPSSLVEEGAPAPVTKPAPDPAAPPEPPPVVEPASAASGRRDPEAEATPSGGSLFDDDSGSLFGDAEEQADKPQATEAKSEVEGTQGGEGKLGGSLFGDGASLFDTPVDEETKHQDIPAGTSLFDVGDPEPEPAAKPAPAPAEKAAVEPALGSEIPEGQSLFDVGEPEPEPAAGPRTGRDASRREVRLGGRRRHPGGPVALRRQPTRPGRAQQAGHGRRLGRPRDHPRRRRRARAGRRTRGSRSPRRSRSRRPAGRPTPRTDADINQTGSLFDL